MSENPDKSFERDISKFFSRPSTKSAMGLIFSRKHVVIYCGAGVTLDRTGSGWSDLIAQLLNGCAEDGAPLVHAEDAGALSKVMDSQKMATILRAFYGRRYGEARSLGNLQADTTRLLYGENEWRSGRLVSSIANFAVEAAFSRDCVTHILTTNYDDHIETEIRGQKEGYDSVSGSLGKVGVTISLAGRRRAVFSLAATHGRPRVTLTYLHGRLPQVGHERESDRGRLVLDEVDYAESHPTTQKVLSREFQLGGSAVVIVGASLTDPPLIEALANTRTTSADRFILFPTESTGLHNGTESQVRRRLAHVEARCERLGLTPLFPDFKFQTAQFFTEVGFPSKVDPDPDFFSSNPSRYGARLVKWWNDWTTRNQEPDRSQQLHKQLRKLVDTLRLDHHVPTEELLKLELWVRWAPATESRELAIWGTSLGILLDASALRKFPLSVFSGHPSVKAFVEGRVQYADLTETPGWEELARTTRWRSFLSVPIYLPQLSRQLQAGVVTLASTFSKHDSALPSSNEEEMQNITQALSVLGNEWLEAPDATTGNPSIGAHSAASELSDDHAGSDVTPNAPA